MNKNSIEKIDKLVQESKAIIEEKTNQYGHVPTKKELAQAEAKIEKGGTEGSIPESGPEAPEPTKVEDAIETVKDIFESTTLVPRGLLDTYKN